VKQREVDELTDDILDELIALKTEQRNPNYKSHEEVRPHQKKNKTQFFHLLHFIPNNVNSGWLRKLCKKTS
jgi:hypothetical protein